MGKRESKKEVVELQVIDKNNKFINDDYKKLYDILRKYDLIYKIESVENSGEAMIS